MFTRCPACDTTFRLGAGDLRRAQGRVRCGECSVVFNALNYLAEEPEEAAAADRWLPEPANDPTRPDDLGLVLSPVADNASDSETDYDHSEEDEVSVSDFSTPLDIYSAFAEEEPIGTSRWNEALQQHEQDETGLDQTVSMRSDYLDPQELDDEVDEVGERKPSQPVMSVEPDQNEASFEDDFDDTIWERIPGVGAQSANPGRPIDLSIDHSAQSEQAAPPSWQRAEIPDVHIDPLEFNAPEETWSDIFVRGTSAPADDEEEDVEEYPKLLAADTETDDSNDMVGLEQIFNPERIPPLIREHADLSGTNTGTAQQSPAAEGADNPDMPDPAFDIAERRRTLADWLTEEVKADATQDYELPEDGYDVQHIILPDESETADAPRDGDLRTAAAGKDDTYVWQTEKESTPSRNGLWLIGGLLLLAVLAIQLVHYNRDSLAVSPTWGNMVIRVYTLLGMDLFPAWSMADYEIRSAEVVAGESGPDIMDIRAKIAVVGNTPTGLPYLRVVLSDRWSKPVAEKTFSPADYIKASDANSGGLLRPGQSIEVHVSIVDPGTGAQGFELELCLPRRYTGMECTGRPFK